MRLKLEQAGSRVYVRGNTFPHRQALGKAGAIYDGRAWYFTSMELARAFVGKKPQKQSRDVTRTQPPPAPASATDEVTTVIGRAVYKAHDYYLLGEWSKEGGHYARLLFTDGSRHFVADARRVTITKRYPQPVPYGSLHNYATGESRKACRCGCHREDNAGQLGTILYDGCVRCGCIA